MGGSPENVRAAPVVTLGEGTSEKFQPWLQHEGRRGWHLPVGEPGE